MTNDYMLLNVKKKERKKINPRISVFSTYRNFILKIQLVPCTCHMEHISFTASGTIRLRDRRPFKKEGRSGLLSGSSTATHCSL